MPNKEGAKSQHRLSFRKPILAVILVLSALIAFINCKTESAHATSPLGITGLRAKDRALVVNSKGEALLALNSEKPSVPASTIKILTALAAFSHLGRDYRFSTFIYLDCQKYLYVKGVGDPYLISEAIGEMASSIAMETRNVEGIILDNTYFESPIEISGSERSTNPYDAPIGALSANFNTVFFETGKDGRVVSAEPQTPITEFAITKIKRSGLSKGRISFLNDSGEAALYFGHLLAHFLNERGVVVKGPIRLGIAPNSPPTLVYTSRLSLIKIVESMMEYSNNFVANQLAVTLGAHLLGPPGNLDKARRVLGFFGRSTLGLSSLSVEEGSGISRGNRISPKDMVVLLAAFEPYRAVLRRNNNILYKSGTLRGIKARSGYIEAGTGRPWRFAIFLEESGSNIDSMMHQIEKAAK